MRGDVDAAAATFSSEAELASVCLTVLILFTFALSTGALNCFVLC